MAEALSNHMTAGWSGGPEFESAGTDAENGFSSNEQAVQVCSEHGLDIAHRKTRQLTREMLD
jgi:protein-tyrosine-phosphatase